MEVEEEPKEVYLQRKNLPRKKAKRAKETIDNKDYHLEMEITAKEA